MPRRRERMYRPKTWMEPNPEPVKYVKPPYPRYRLRPEYAEFEPGLDPELLYFAVEAETADGFVHLMIDGHPVEVDVTHFDRFDGGR